MIIVMRMSRAPGRYAMMLLLASVAAACSTTRALTLVRATVHSRSDSHILVYLNACTTNPQHAVVETKEEVTVTVDDPSASNDRTCIGWLALDLASPLGARILLDGRTHRTVPIELTG